MRRGFAQWRAVEVTTAHCGATGIAAGYAAARVSGTRSVRPRCRQMSKRKKPRVSRRLTSIEQADLFVAETVALDKRSRAGKAVARFAELGDQPPLVILSLGVAAVGALRRDE